jgi:predicted alpha-1,2-mannosidase
MKKIFSLLLFLIVLSCNSDKEVGSAVKDKALISYVNPFIGTGGHGHTYPGATMPFGMVQLSPDTRLDGWDGCSGYHYSDNYIYGFSHTHLSGTGVSDYGDILLMPTNELIFHNGADGKKGYRAHFSHERETASPGYYQVQLDSTNIHVELTVTPRAGMHKYSYPSSDNQFLILDLEHRDQFLDIKVNALSQYEVKGYRISKAWAEDQRVYFHIRFSHPIEIPTHFHRDPDRSTRMAGYQFINPNNDPVFVSIGISSVSEDGARLNLENEIGDRSFDEIRAEAENTWEQHLEKIIIETENDQHKTIFYTSMYHSMLAPNLYQDVDGQYRGMDMEVHKTKDFDYYTVFSLWDTYRATHPLYTIIDQKRTNDFIRTLLAKYDEGGIMPIWDLSSNYTGCMIGYHGVSVISDAFIKDIRDFDGKKALMAMKHSAMQDHLGLKSYKEFGFIPVEEESESVSKTLEYAYDDWTIAQMARAMGEIEDYRYYIGRAQNYKNVFDPESKFMRGRFRNTWFAPFDPFEVNFNYTEANAWQYSFYVPQDISGFIELLGGKQALESQLDSLFEAEKETSGRDQADITGLIGQYAHGNEPSHHMAYLYNFVNKPSKTQEKVNQILTELYQNAPDGISGNEDCGQMSAWYVFSSLGFYPVTPGGKDYIIGSPLFDKATINLENGNRFTIQTKGRTPKNIYIKKAFLNNIPLERTYISHEEIISGGSLVFHMSDKPMTWGSEEGQEPRTGIHENLITPSPYIAEGEVAFKNETTVKLDVASRDAVIYVSVDGSDFSPYTKPIRITENTLIRTYAEKNGSRSSELSTQFYKIDPNLSITLETQYANQYNAGGNNALIDGIRGSRDFRTGAWQGYQDTDLVAIVDLGSIKPINSIRVSFLQDQRSWIFFPTEVECYVAPGKTFYKSLPKQVLEAAVPNDETEIKTLEFNMNGYSSRYIKIVARNLGDLPEWHLGAPHNGKAWIFVDEITID